ncbi:hypothetical protein ACSTS3_06675 [Aquimarina muelleri]|uniref:hypothetical protein n=1 Tax=Aquimarina muelleri TaxID=279356 RepID=UPI003F689505
MKVIKDEDLLYLHYQIEKSEVKQKKLEDLLKEESKKSKKIKTSNKILGFLSLIFFISTVFLTSNMFFFKVSETDSVQKKSIIEKELIVVKEELEALKNKKINIEEIKNLYLYRKLIDKDTVYSVQVKALNSKGISSISNKYTNTLVYNDTSYYKMSLGIFETLNEAQDFRKLLINSGFDKRIFVISYKDGKRLKIENYQ